VIFNYKKEEPMAQAGGSKEAWNARQNLMDAAHLIESACAWAEKDEEVYDRLAAFEWNVVSAPLEESAQELRRAAESIVTAPAQKFEVWETTEHLCGYSVASGESDYCFHEGCWEEMVSIRQALSLQQAARHLLHNFEVDEEDRWDQGYSSMVTNLAEWHEWWNAYMSGSKKQYDALTEEQKQRISSVVDNGGKFEDFIARELFFIEEGSK
jgi:hypothetical protein